jgi:hypothetical protein
MRQVGYIAGICNIKILKTILATKLKHRKCSEGNIEMDTNKKGRGLVDVGDLLTSHAA